MLARRGSADSAAKPRVWRVRREDESRLPIQRFISTPSLVTRPGRSAAGRSSLCVLSV